MRFQDIQRQAQLYHKGKWINQCCYYIKSVSEPHETTTGSWCQTIEAVDSVGVCEVLNGFSNSDSPEEILSPAFLGKQWLNVRWLPDKGYFQFCECEPPAVVPLLEEGGPDWYNINLGKCRHGIMCAMITGGVKPDELDFEMIRKLALFSMTGQIEDKTETKK